MVPAIVRSVERAIPVLAISAAVVSCGAGEPLPRNAGVSERRAPSGARLIRDAGAAVRWARAAEVEGYPHVSRASFPSLGHFVGRWIADVVASPEAAVAYGALAPGTRLAVGSVIVEQLRDAPTGRRGPWFAMEKREAGFYPSGGDWLYVVLDAQGQVEDEGKLAGCARCHADGVGDSLFGLPPAGR